MFVKMCDNFEELSETYFRFSVALLRAEFGFLTKLNDSTTMKGKCYDVRYNFFIKSQHAQKFAWLLFLGFRPFN